MFAVPPNTVAAPGRAGLEHPVRTALRYAADRGRWRHLLRHTPDTRWFGLLERTDDQEIWLLSWLPGQGTGTHDHGRAHGAYTVISGVLTEHVIHPDRREAHHVVHTGQSRVFGPSYLHRVHNHGADPAVSLHVYRPGRVAMTTYTASGDGVLVPSGVDIGAV